MAFGYCGTSTAARKSKGASALGGSADLFAQRLRQEKQLAFKSQKSKSSNFEALSDLEWVVYFCRCVLGLVAYGIYTII